MFIVLLKHFEEKRCSVFCLGTSAQIYIVILHITKMVKAIQSQK